MLVLTRRTNETIKIGDDVRVTVCRVQGGNVRLGIDAPPDKPILRGELTNRDSAAAAQPATCPA